MTLSEALDIVYGHTDWWTPIAPYVVSGISQTPYEAYGKLRVEFQGVVRRLIEHEPTRDEE